MGRTADEAIWEVRTVGTRREGLRKRRQEGVAPARFERQERRSCGPFAIGPPAVAFFGSVEVRVEPVADAVRRPAMRLSLRSVPSPRGPHYISRH